MIGTTTVRIVPSVLAMIVVSTLGARQALALACGDVLTEDTTLETDLECVGTALVIAADDVTLNLDGHTLTSLDGLGVGVVVAESHRGVTIKNGVIEGFEQAVLARNTSDLRIEGLTIPGVSGSGLPPTGFAAIGAIKIVGGRNVRIADSSIASGPAVIDGRPGPDGILLYSVEDVRIEDVDIESAYVGVNFVSCGDPDLDPECPPLGEQPPSTGVVGNCTITDTFVGIGLLNATDVMIEGNFISDAEQGIRIGLIEDWVPTGVRIQENEITETVLGILAWIGISSEPFTALTIRENFIHENYVSGMELVSVVDSDISENTVVDNLYGISLWAGSFGNTIAENTVTGHEVDMFHDDSCTPNTWRENTCQLSWGTEIDCGTP